MAGNTFLGRTREHTVDMAFRTGSADMRSSQREGGQVVIEGGGLPAGSGVTGRAVGSVFAAVVIIGCMAGKTGCRRTLELHILMAAATGDGCVFAGQFETGVGMVKGAGLPGGGCMAGFALCAKCAAVRVNASMT